MYTHTHTYTYISICFPYIYVFPTSFNCKALRAEPRINIAMTTVTTNPTWVQIASASRSSSAWQQLRRDRKHQPDTSRETPDFSIVNTILFPSGASRGLQTCRYAAKARGQPAVAARRPSLVGSIPPLPPPTGPPTPTLPL